MCLVEVDFVSSAREVVFDLLYSQLAHRNIVLEDEDASSRLTAVIYNSVLARRCYIETTNNSILACTKPRYSSTLSFCFARIVAIGLSGKAW